MSCSGSSTGGACNQHPNGCPEWAHTYRDPGYSAGPFAELFEAEREAEAERLTWQELERLELRAYKASDAEDEDGQIIDLYLDLAETCELLAALLHHREVVRAQAVDTPTPIDVGGIGSSVDRSQRREWSMEEIADLVSAVLAVRELANKSREEMTNLERIVGRKATLY